MTDAARARGGPPADTQTLAVAVYAGDTARVKSLLDAGADPNERGYRGRTMLMRAISGGHLEVVQALLDAGAHINAKKENGATALIMAVFFGHADIVRLLLAAGADPTVPTPQGVSAEEWARTAGFDEVAALLRDAEAVPARGFGPQGELTDEEPLELGPVETVPPEIFPSSGTFRPVVPLSEFDDDSPASEDAAPEAATVEAVEVADDLNERSAKVKQEDVQEDEQDETTLVPARVHTPPPPPPARVPLGARPARTLQSWPVMVLTLALLLTAGVILEGKWRNSRLSARNPQPAQDAPAAAESEAQVAAVRPAEDEAPLQPPRPEAQASTPSPRAVAEPKVVLKPPADTSGGSAEKTPKAERAGKADRAPNARAAAAESKRAPEAEPPSRRASKAEARAKAPAASTVRARAVAPKSEPARREERAARRPRNAGGQVSTSTPPRRSLPVSSPPPSAKSEKVIQWP